ncbi:MAG: hypothetical protein ACD_68C00036G0001 [uncultured bacterium]|nr:MAG: hypothetical protein ACD_68C00036G0001 [uncultured bacterium]
MNDDLLKLDYQKNIINKYAVHSQGCPGIFFDYCRQPDKLSALLEQEKELVEFLAWPIQQRLSFWESRLKNSRFDLGKHIDHWIYFIHQVISRQSSKGQLKPLENQSPNKLKENLQLLLLTKAAIRQSGNVRLNLENLSIQL